MPLERRWNLVRMRLRSLFDRRHLEEELDRELRYHLEQQVEENRARGMTEAEARQNALRALGALTQLQEECRDMRRTHYLEHLFQDLRYAVRMLARTPGFATVIVLSLALSIGATCAIFSVIEGVLLRPLPYREPGRLVRVFFTSRTYPKFPLNPFDFRDLRERTQAFEGLAGFSRHDWQLSGDGPPVRFAGFAVTAGYFQVLGLNLARGSEFTTADERPEAEPSVILSDRVWHDRFGADPSIIGRKIILDSRPFLVKGVAAPGTQHTGNQYHALADGETVDVWTPFWFEGNPSNRGSHYLEGLGRLRPGVTIAQAQTDLDRMVAQLAREHPGTRGWQGRLIPLYQELVGPSRRMLLVLLGAVGLVLLIACANSANLLLARATARQREIAVRSALGAARSRLMRQMLAESLLLAAVGGILGTSLSIAGVRGLVALLPAEFPRAGSIHVNATVLGFTLLLTLATGILFGMAPALQAGRTDPQQNLRDGGRGSTAGRRFVQLRQLLVVGEISLACVLLIGAGLMLRSFVRLLRTDPGFRAEHVVTAAISLPRTHYSNRQSVAAFYDQLSAKLASIPGVQAAGLGTDLPWTGYDENISGLNLEGKTPPPNESFHGRYHVASPDYFRAIGIPLVRGRFFDERDRQGAPRVLIVNQAMARRYWPDEDPVGKRLAFNDHPAESDWMTIVGVVGDVKDHPQNASAQNAFWWPMLQMPFGFPEMSIALRSSSGAAPLVDQMRGAVAQLDPTLAVAEIRRMEQIASASVSTPRFTLFLVGGFAALAVTLAGIGIYGLIAYTVTLRIHEFGLRIALGAKPAQVMIMVMAQGARLAAIGVFLGVAGAIGLARLLRTLLFEVSPSDPFTFSLAPMAAILIALLACYLPARHAAAADPIAALRSE